MSVGGALDRRYVRGDDADVLKLSALKYVASVIMKCSAVMRLFFSACMAASRLVLFSAVRLDFLIFLASLAASFSDAKNVCSRIASAMRGAVFSCLFVSQKAGWAGPSGGCDENFSFLGISIAKRAVAK